MEIVETHIAGLYLINYFSNKDSRGEFIKTIHASSFEKSNLDFRFQESFFSVSNKNVIRGMHFQIPPDDQNKLVFLIKGRIVDVVIDLRKQSMTFGQYFVAELTESKRQGLYIGKGMAHGFLSLEDNSIVEYHTSTIHNIKTDLGIHYNSFGYDWGVSKPIISDRDLSFPFLNKFISPF